MLCLWGMILWKYAKVSCQGRFTCHDGGNDAIPRKDFNRFGMLCQGNRGAKLLADARPELGHLSNPFQLDGRHAWISVGIDEPWRVQTFESFHQIHSSNPFHQIHSIKYTRYYTRFILQYTDLKSFELKSTLSAVWTTKRRSFSGISKFFVDSI